MKIYISGLDSENNHQNFEVVQDDKILTSNICGHFEIWHTDYPDDSACRILQISLFTDMDTVVIELYKGYVERAYNYFG